MPFVFKGRLADFHEPIDHLSSASLRDLANALRPFARSGSRVENKIKDIEAELEWRRAAHTKASA